MLQEVTAMLQGFQTARRTLQLSVGQNAGIDIMLALGAVSETIEVSASALGVETRSSVLGTLVTREQIENQPLKTFDPSITKQFYLNSQRDKSVQLRLEAFNVLNRANFAIPTVGNLTVFTSPTERNPTAGMITRTQTPGRQMQLGLVVSF